MTKGRKNFPSKGGNLGERNFSKNKGIIRKIFTLFQKEGGTLEEGA